MAGLLALLTVPPSRAAIDAQLNTSNFVSGQASELSVDGVITTGGPSTSITGAAMTISFDPADVTLSGFRAGAGWSLQNTNTDNLAQGWVKAVLSNTSNDGAGQASTGPILYFTVTPANGQVDVDDCGTLRLVGPESDLADQAYEQVYISDPCEGMLQPRVYSYDVPDGFSGRTDRAELADNCPLAKALTNLRITAGLQGFAPDDLVYLDLDRNRKVDIVDAVLALENPCFSIEATYDQGPYASPAIQDIDGNGTKAVVVAVQSQAWSEPLCTNPLDPTQSDPRFCTSNPELVYLYGWTGTGLDTLTGWPQRLRDSSQGVAIANLGSGYRVLASCFQDNHLDNPLDPNETKAKPADWPACVSPFLGSRVYAWDIGGNHLSPWCPPPVTVPSLPDSQRLLLPWGHTTAAPVVYQPDDEEPIRVVQAAQGRYADWTRLTDRANPPTCQAPDRSDPKYGKLLVWNADGSLLGATQSTDPDEPWYVMPEDAAYPGDPAKSRFSVSAPPVIANLLGTGADCVVAATDDGWLYAWDADGVPVPGWHPAADLSDPPVPAPKTDVFPGGTQRCGITALDVMVAVDLSGTGRDDVLLCIGDNRTAYRYGRLYRFLSTGGDSYRVYPPDDLGPAIGGGIAVGRLGSEHADAKCIVFGNEAGQVIALDGNLAEIWKVDLPDHGPVLSQPAIGDVNDDGRQEVVVAGTGGFVYAIDGDTGELLWRVPTPVSVIGPTAYREHVFGPGVALLPGSGHLYCVILSTADTPSGQRGHLWIIDCGVTNTDDHSRYDWPQYQQNARRSGRSGES